MKKMKNAFISNPNFSYVAISQLKRASRNPKTHDIGEISKSMTRFGFIAPIVLDGRTGKVVAGHGRLDTLQSLKAQGKRSPANIRVIDKEWFAPVLSINFKDDAEAEAYLIADNRITERGGWNNEQLATMLADLASHGSLEAVGFDTDDLDALLRGLQGSAVGETPADKLPDFLSQEIKQIVLYFKGDDYGKIIETLDAIREAQNLEDHTAVIQWLVDQHNG